MGMGWHLCLAPTRCKKLAEQVLVIAVATAGLKGMAQVDKVPVVEGVGGSSSIGVLHIYEVVEGSVGEGGSSDCLAERSVGRQGHEHPAVG